MKSGTEKFDVKRAMVAAVSKALKYKDKNKFVTNEEIINHVVEESDNILENLDRE